MALWPRPQGLARVVGVLALVVGARGLVAVRPARGASALSAKVVVADGFTATERVFADRRAAWAPAVRAGVDELVVFDRTAARDAADVLAGATVAVVNKVAITADLLDELPDLELVCVTATGVNNVDLGACEERGVKVCNVPAYSTPSVAQYVAACLLDSAVALPSQAAAVKGGAWAESKDFCAFPASTVELAGKTFVAVGGRGAIGSAAAGIAEALGMDARAVSCRGDGAGAMDRDLRAADFVSLHVPLAEETADLVDRQFLDKLKPGAVLVNSARGGLVDEAALLEALDDGRLRRAYLDVLKEEPPSLDSPSHRLTQHPAAVVTPHTAWATNEARTRLVDVAVSNVRAFLDGKPLLTPVT